MHKPSFFETSRRYRWFMISIFFAFMLLHQADKLLIGPLTTDIMETFGISMTQMGAVSTGALIVGALFYPLWGYLYDRYARPKLLALASFLWGATTWLNALAPTYNWFLVTRSSTGIDDSSYPGLYSLVSDYFEPKIRGKVYGLLQLTGPIGYLMGMVLGLILSGIMEWRGIFFLTGSLGMVVAVVIFFFIKDAPRGQSEPEMQEVTETTIYRFEWSKAIDLFHNKTLLLVIAQGFFGVFPWNAITYWFFVYLETERGYSSNETLIVMGLSVIILAAGYPLGGALGDALFKRTPAGRAIVGMIGVFIGAILFAITLTLPHTDKTAFMVMMSLSAIFIPLAAPNVIATVYDITLPEVRSTALAVEYFLESIGAALAPLMVGLIADASSLQQAFLWICTIAWIICGVFFYIVIRLVPNDIQKLRIEMKHRSDLELAKQAAQGESA
jgi:MFS family permease